MRTTPESQRAAWRAHPGVYAVDGWRGIAFTVYGFPVDPTDDFDGTSVIVVMVGDDQKHLVDVDDLHELSQDEFCAGCGQIGCGHG